MSSKNTMKIRLVLERLGLILFGLVLAVILFEIVLRLGSLFFGSRAIENAVTSSGHTILCLGDSHTYGVYYSPEEAYPGQLQTLLNRRAPNRYHVINLGVPGMNSSQIRTKLPSWFEEYRPKTIIVGAGINNLWNISDTQRSGASGGSSVRSLRVYRLYRLLAAAIEDTRFAPETFTARPELQRIHLQGGEGGVEHQDTRTGEVLARNAGSPRKRLSPDHASELLWQDLETIYRLANRGGVRLILLTYSAFPLPDRPPRFTTFQLLNDTMRRFSRERQVDLVDVHDRVLGLLSGDVPRKEYFASKKDDHPNPRGYAEIAALVAETVTGSKPQPRP